MAAAIAHHFNNQLQAITINMELAKSCLPRGTGSTEFLADVLKSANKVAEVSNMMLTYLGETVAKLEPLNLSDTCQQHLPTLRAAVAKDVILKTDILRPGPVIKGDANQIQQILTNLVTNAVEATSDKRGVIRLSIKTVLARDIAAENRFPANYQPPAKDFACLEVADSGVGIAGDDIENLFDPFFSSKFTGRGMGLAVVLGILRAHSGCITVESKSGQGSIFRVFLPMLAETASSKPVPASPPPQGKLILVVEDDPSVCNAFEIVLKLFGYSVLTAGDGLEGVEIFKQHKGKIDCVLCDVCMPRMNGWDTLAALRKLSPKIPVIITSGYSEPHATTGNKHSEQPQAFLSKPFDLQKLAETLKRVLENAKR
jgi:CheY-like chemotaxis protein